MKKTLFIAMLAIRALVFMTGCTNEEAKNEKEPFVKGIEVEEIEVEDILIEEILTEEQLVENAPAEIWQTRWYVAVRLQQENGVEYTRDVILDGEPDTVHDDETGIWIVYKDGHRVVLRFGIDEILGCKVWSREVRAD